MVFSKGLSAFKLIGNSFSPIFTRVLETAVMIPFFAKFVDQPDVAAAIAWQEAIPPMRVAVNERQVAARRKPREQARALVEQPLVEFVPLGRHDLVELFDEACKLTRKDRQILFPIRSGPYSD